jgi:hypothetical protein
MKINSLKIKRSDYFFLIILIGGLILRIFYFNFFNHNDTIGYVISAKGIINFNYQSSREPGFPLTIVPFILLFEGYSLFPAKLASLSASLLLIIASYVVFTKAYLKFSKNDIKRAKHIGLMVSFLVSLNSFLASHTGKGLREDLMALLILLIFYFTIINEKIDIKNNIGLSFSISFLTLTHNTVALFTMISILLYFLISKLKIIKNKNINTKRIFIILVSFGLSFFLFLLFLGIGSGNPFINFESQRFYYKYVRGLDLSSIEHIFEALFKAIFVGVPIIFYYLIILISFSFICLVLYTIVKNIKKPQILLLFLLLIINFAYVSIFIVPGGNENFPICPRLFSYYFPAIFYIGSIPLENIIFKSRREKKNINNLLIFFLIFYIIKGLFLVYYLKNIDYFRFSTNIILLILFCFSASSQPVFIIIYLIDETMLIIYLIKNRDLQFS